MYTSIDNKTVNSMNVTSFRQPHGVPTPHTFDRVPLVFTVLLHLVVLIVLVWFGRNLTPLPMPQHIKAMIVPSSVIDSLPAQKQITNAPKPSASAKPRVTQDIEKKNAALEAEAAAALKAQKVAAKQQEKIENAKAITAKKDADKQAQVERAYTLKKSRDAEKLKIDIEKKQAAKAAEDKEKAQKEALENSKRKEKAIKAAKEKADKAEKEQALKEAEIQENADKVKAAEAAADAKRRLTQSLSNDDDVVSSLKGQVAATAKANSIGKYASQIQSHIKSAWSVPAGSSGLKAIARFTLASNGSVLSVVIIRSSGNDDFDNSIKTLRNLNGVPMPSDSDIFSQVRTPTITFVAP
jgi:colicin import membrane protein